MSVIIGTFGQPQERALRPSGGGGDSVDPVEPTPIGTPPPPGLDITPGPAPVGLLTLPATVNTSYSRPTAAGSLKTWTDLMWSRLESSGYASARQNTINSASDRTYGRNITPTVLRMAHRATGDKALLDELDKWMQGYRSKLSIQSGGIRGWAYMNRLEWHLTWGDIGATVYLFWRNGSVALANPSGGETTFGQRAAWWLDLMMADTIRHPEFMAWPAMMHPYSRMAQLYFLLWQARGHQTSKTRLEHIIDRMRGKNASTATWLRAPISGGRHGFFANKRIGTAASANTNWQLWTDYAFIPAAAMMELAPEGVHFINPAQFPNYRQEFVAAIAERIFDTATSQVASDPTPFSTGLNGENPKGTKLSLTGVGHDGQTYTIQSGSDRNPTKTRSISGTKNRFAVYAPYGYCAAWADNTTAVVRPGGASETDRQRIINQYHAIHAAAGGGSNILTPGSMVVAYSPERS